MAGTIFGQSFREIFIFGLFKIVDARDVIQK